MVRVGERTDRRVRAGLVALLLFAGSGAFGSGGSLFAQSIELFVPNRPFTPDEQFEVRLSLADLPSTEVEVMQPEYPRILEVVEEPSVTTRVVDRDNGEQRTATAVIAFRAVSPGRAILPPIQVRSGDTIVESDERLIEVSEEGAPTRVPFNVAWQSEHSQIFQGQTIAVTLEMRLVPSFTYPSEIEISSPESGLFAEVQGLGSSSSGRFNEQTYYTYPVATFLFTPSRTGTVSIPAATVRALDYTRVAPSLELEVTPVPDEIAETGAIGKLRFESTLTPRRSAVGERVTLEMSVRGTGNLTFLEFPAPQAEGLVVTETQESEQIEPARDGYSGRRTRRIEFSTTEAGQFTVTVPAFRWLDPTEEQIRRVAPQEFEVAVGSAMETDKEGEEQALQLLTADQVRRIEPFDLFRTPSAYGLFLPAFFAVVVVALYRKFGRPKAVTLFALTLFVSAGIAPPVPESEIARGVEAYREGNAEAAIRAFDRALEERPGSPGIRYNLGIAHFAAGDEGDALYFLRTAVQAKPHFAEASAAINRIEEQLGLNRQVELQGLVHPDIFFFASLALFYMLCGLLILPQRVKRGFYFVFAIILGLVCAASIAAIPLTAQQQARPVAVIDADEAVLRRIPEEGAATWMNLTEGTSVRLEAEHERYYLVSTAYGVEGWIPRDSLIVGNIADDTM